MFVYDTPCFAYVWETGKLGMAEIIFMVYCFKTPTSSSIVQWSILVYIKQEDFLQKLRETRTFLLTLDFTRCDHVYINFL